jgi:hypothetical protein
VPPDITKAIRCSTARGAKPSLRHDAHWARRNSPQARRGDADVAANILAAGRSRRFRAAGGRRVQ